MLAACRYIKAYWSACLTNNASVQHCDRNWCRYQPVCRPPSSLLDCTDPDSNCIDPVEGLRDAFPIWSCPQHGQALTVSHSTACEVFVCLHALVWQTAVPATWIRCQVTTQMMGPSGLLCKAHTAGQSSLGSAAGMSSEQRHDTKFGIVSAPSLPRRAANTRHPNH